MEPERPVESPQDAAVLPPTLATSTACIPIQVKDSPAPSVLVGTLIRPAQPAENPTMVVLVPGADTPRIVFDSSFDDASLERGETLQRYLAQSGYAVLAIDRPGMGASAYTLPPTYTGQDVDLVTDALHQAVQSLRGGGWWVADDDACRQADAGFKVPKVVLGGHSLGGLIVRLYAMQHDDIDGLLSLGMDQAPSQNVVQMTGFCYPSTYLPSRMGRVFCDAPEGIPTCETVIGHKATHVEDRILASCQILRMTPDPILPLFSAKAVVESQQNIADVAPMPVHHVYFQYDAAMHEPGAQAAEAEQDVEAWRTGCPGCNVTSFTVSGTGHFWTAFRSQAVWYQNVVDWLEGSGIGAGTTG